jgi:hypothetical protein
MELCMIFMHAGFPSFEVQHFFKADGKRESGDQNLTMGNLAKKKL